MLEMEPLREEMDQARAGQETRAEQACILIRSAKLWKLAARTLTLVERVYGPNSADAKQARALLGSCRRALARAKLATIPLAEAKRTRTLLGSCRRALARAKLATIPLADSEMLMLDWMLRALKRRKAQGASALAASARILQLRARLRGAAERVYDAEQGARALNGERGARGRALLARAMLIGVLTTSVLARMLLYALPPKGAERPKAGLVWALRGLLVTALALGVSIGAHVGGVAAAVIAPVLAVAADLALLVLVDFVAVWQIRRQNERGIRPLHAPAAHAGAARVLALVEQVVPMRIAREEIGDAIEDIQRMAEHGGMRWWIYRRVATTIFWALVNAAKAWRSKRLLASRRARH